MSKATQYDDYIHVYKNKYKLGSNLVWEIGLLGSGWELTVPKDFEFDISVPKWLQWLISPHHRAWFLGSAIHDYLLKNGFDRGFAAGEWYRGARAMREKDSLRWLVLVAYFMIVLRTAGERVTDV